MSNIKHKIGQCCDCVAIGDYSEKPLIAGRCKGHYWKHRASVKNSKPLKSKAKYVKDPDLEKWFENQVMMCFKYCECCGYPIYSPSKLNIAHILPKRDNMYPEIRTHPLNVVYLCWDCHTNYDNQGKDFAIKMPCLEKMKLRVLKMQEQLSRQQWERVPDYLKFI